LLFFMAALSGRSLSARHVSHCLLCWVLLLLLLLQLPLLAPWGACAQEGPAPVQLRTAAVPRRQKGAMLGLDSNVTRPLLLPLLLLLCRLQLHVS
jgi:hypothetical protein